MPAPTTTISTSSGTCPRESQKEGALANEDAASVDVQDLPCDVPGERRGKEEDRGGDVLGGRDTVKRDRGDHLLAIRAGEGLGGHVRVHPARSHRDRKSTRLNSSHANISYA